MPTHLFDTPCHFTPRRYARVALTHNYLKLKTGNLTDKPHGYVYIPLDSDEARALRDALVEHVPDAPVYIPEHGDVFRYTSDDGNVTGVYMRDDNRGDGYQAIVIRNSVEGCPDAVPGEGVYFGWDGSQGTYEKVEL